MLPQTPLSETATCGRHPLPAGTLPCENGHSRDTSMRFHLADTGQDAPPRAPAPPQSCPADMRARPRHDDILERKNLSPKASQGNGADNTPPFARLRCQTLSQPPQQEPCPGYTGSQTPAYLRFQDAPPANRTSEPGMPRSLPNPPPVPLHEMPGQSLGIPFHSPLQMRCNVFKSVPVDEEAFACFI